MHTYAVEYTSLHAVVVTTQKGARLEELGLHPTRRTMRGQRQQVFLSSMPVRTAPLPLVTSSNRTQRIPIQIQATCSMCKEMMTLQPFANLEEHAVFFSVFLSWSYHNTQSLREVPLLDFLHFPREGDEGRPPTHTSPGKGSDMSLHRTWNRDELHRTCW